MEKSKKNSRRLGVVILQVPRSGVPHGIPPADGISRGHHCQSGDTQHSELHDVSMQWAEASEGAYFKNCCDFERTEDAVCLQNALSLTSRSFLHVGSRSEIRRCWFAADQALCRGSMVPYSPCPMTLVADVNVCSHVESLDIRVSESQSCP